MSLRTVLMLLILLVSLLFVAPRARSESSPADQPRVNSAGVTGVIVDCKGYQTQRAMSPKIRREDDSEVWGTVKADYDKVIQDGIVGYATSVEDAKKLIRAGANPILVKALGSAGGKFCCDPVISNGDTEILLRENKKTKFLDNFHVIIVIDGPADK